jgi:HK97 family phage prohead protease
MHKTAPLVQVKAGPDDGLAEGQFTGYASVFGNKDSYGDVVQPGAFTDTLAEWTASGNSLPVLWGHDMYDPFSNIGWVTSATEDDKGLLVDGQLDLDNAKGQQVYRLLKGRRVSQMSFAYDVLEGGARTEDGEDFYSLDKLKLYEVSIVPIGANQETEILAVKAAADAARVAADSKEGRVLAAKHIDSLRSAQELVAGVIAAAESDQEKASEHGPATSQEPLDGATDQEPSPTSHVKRLAAEATIYALTGAGRGSG